MGKESVEGVTFESSFDLDVVFSLFDSICSLCSLVLFDSSASPSSALENVAIKDPRDL